VVTREKPDALLVPSDAVQGSSVLLVEGSRVRVRHVDVGIRGSRAVEVVSGLSEQDRIASPMPQGLADGARVRVTGAKTASK